MLQKEILSSIPCNSRSASFIIKDSFISYTDNGTIWLLASLADPQIDAIERLIRSLCHAVLLSDLKTLQPTIYSYILKLSRYPASAANQPTYLSPGDSSTRTPSLNLILPDPVYLIDLERSKGTTDSRHLLLTGMSAGKRITYHKYR